MNLGARTAMWSGGAKMPTARDYVQDGLIHLADGIENGGYGIHDESLGKIIDCVTGSILCNKIQLLDGGAWLETGGRANESYARYFSEDATITSTFTPNDYGWWAWELGSIHAIDGYTGNNIEDGPIISGRNPIAVYMSGYSGTVLSMVSGSFVKKSANSITLVWHGGSKTFDVYVGDTFKGSADCSSVWRSGMTRWVYCVYSALYFTENYKFVLHNGRCYSRALPADEIAANYAIDKARFGLP